MSWLSKNWYWLALGGGAIYLITRSKSNVATPGGIVELPTSQYTTNASGELVGEDIDKLKSEIMVQLGAEFSGLVSIYPNPGDGRVRVAIEGTYKGGDIDLEVLQDTVAKALVAAKAGMFVPA